MTADTLAAPAVSRPADGYPVSVTVTRPDRQSRAKSFPLGIGTFIRLLLAIPHFVILYFFQIVMVFVCFMATFVILFTGRFPRDMFDLVESYFRWLTNVQGYVMKLYDTYPPFSMTQQDYPLHVDVAYPEHSSRLLNFPIFGFIIKALALIPHFFVLGVLGLVAFVMVFFAAFAILFTGSFPAGMHRFVSGVLRWGLRLSAYIYALTDTYPPYSLTVCCITLSHCCWR